MNRKRFAWGTLLACALTAPALAGPEPQAAANPLSTWLRNAYTSNRNYIVRAAEAMPEDSYNLRPGPQTEVMTFGQIVGHLANYNFAWCADVKGERNPNEGNDLQAATSKAALVKGITDAMNYCDGAYGSMTDARGEEMIEVAGPNNTRVRMPRIARLIQNYGHNQEHYGNLVTYLRIKSIVPPSSMPNP